MITCSNCRHQEYYGELYCTRCGGRLWAIAPEAPKTLTFDMRQAGSKTRGAEATSVTNLQVGQIALAIVGTPQVIVLEGRQEYILGREGQASHRVDVDLTPCGARDKGVSRQHASIRLDQGQVLLTDLGSANGTWYRDARLEPHRPVRLAHGDEIRLGALAARLYFRL